MWFQCTFFAEFAKLRKDPACFGLIPQECCSYLFAQGTYRSLFYFDRVLQDVDVVSLDVKEYSQEFGKMQHEFAEMLVCMLVGGLFMISSDCA